MIFQKDSGESISKELSNSDIIYLNEYYEVFKSHGYTIDKKKAFIA
jgi:hypothetical protein